MSVSIVDFLYRIINQNPGKNCVVDEVSANEIYVGFNVSGVAFNVASWKIGRIGRTGSTYQIEWAEDGTPRCAWTSRTTYFSALVLPNTYSLKLDGINDIATFGDNYGFDLATAFSWSGWFYPQNTAADRCLISKCEVTGNVLGYNLKHNPSGQLTVQMRSSGSLASPHTFTDMVLTSLAWNHVVFTYSGNSNFNGWKCYLNGVASAVLPSSSAMSGTMANTSNLMFGARNNIFYFSGNIDEPAVFNKALSAAEVLELYNTGTPIDLSTFSDYGSILSFWRCGDGDVAPTITDQKASVNGTLTNGALFELVAP